MEDPEASRGSCASVASTADRPREGEKVNGVHLGVSEKKIVLSLQLTVLVCVLRS